LQKTLDAADGIVLCVESSPSSSQKCHLQLCYGHQIAATNKEQLQNVTRILWLFSLLLVVASGIKYATVASNAARLIGQLVLCKIRKKLRVDISHGRHFMRPSWHLFL
jgi:hypothetical protein